MNAYRSRFIRRSAIVGALLSIVLIGNLRTQAAELSKARCGTMQSCSKSSAVRSVVPDANGGGVVADQHVGNRVNDDVEVLPAVYSLDPTAQVVFSRRPSKWM